MSAASPFTPDQQRTFDAETAPLFAKYPAEHRAAALIPVLHLAQELRGHLEDPVVDYVADVVGVPATRVREVITFYSMLRTKPVGEKHVQVCVNLACWLRGSDKLVEACKRHIGEQQLQPTADGQASWCEVECLASCGTAPAAMINDRYHESFTVEELERELAK